MTMVATRVFMVRHGATVLSAEDRFAGVTDAALSEEGREQARRLAERLSDKKISAVYASPLGRTDEAARRGRKISGGNGRMGKRPIYVCPGGWGERAGRNSARFACVNRFGT